MASKGVKLYRLLVSTGGTKEDGGRMKEEGKVKEGKARMKNVWRAELKEKMRTWRVREDRQGRWKEVGRGVERESTWGEGMVSGVWRKEEKQKRGNLCRFVAQVLHTFARPCLPLAPPLTWDSPPAFSPPHLNQPRKFKELTKTGRENIIPRDVHINTAIHAFSTSRGEREKGEREKGREKVCGL
ncbi:hypothetical protein E2C01_063733 [Portunus trituberculatus]|uniref:Uncharacterized protein n=1 Tax=Portunus trituberculatus TaxID=210409 RepID=A0A5B7HLC0_PORTR|nr:hypothetical protein [Portunus trituberculatus]